jgi:hypothetical protein
MEITRIGPVSILLITPRYLYFNNRIACSWIYMFANILKCVIMVSFKGKVR